MAKDNVATGLARAVLGVKPVKSRDGWVRDMERGVLVKTYKTRFSTRKKKPKKVKTLREAANEFAKAAKRAQGLILHMNRLLDIGDKFPISRDSMYHHISLTAGVAKFLQDVKEDFRERAKKV